MKKKRESVQFLDFKSRIFNDVGRNSIATKILKPQRGSGVWDITQEMLGDMAWHNAITAANTSWNKSQVFLFYTFS